MSRSYLTYTNEETHRIIRDNLYESSFYRGDLEGIGPRYCPAIEDKILRFPDKKRHQMFLEPEGLDTEEVYVQGMSTSLPENVQLEFLRTIAGMKRVKMMRTGYSIEYNYINPTQLQASLETKAIRGLFVPDRLTGLLVMKRLRHKV